MESPIDQLAPQSVPNAEHPLDGDLQNRLARLEQSIKSLPAEPAPSVLADINSQITVLDSLIEFCRLPGELTSRYNSARIAYAQACDSRQLYFAVDREKRIGRMANEAERISDAQELLRVYVEKQGTGVDLLTRQMGETEGAMGGAVEELETQRRRVVRRMRVWRWAAVLVGLVVAGTLYRVIA